MPAPQPFNIALVLLLAIPIVAIAYCETHQPPDEDDAVSTPAPAPAQAPTITISAEALTANISIGFLGLSANMVKVGQLSLVDKEICFAQSKLLAPKVGELNTAAKLLPTADPDLTLMSDFAVACLLCEPASSLFCDAYPVVANEHVTHHGRTLLETMPRSATPKPDYTESQLAVDLRAMVPELLWLSVGAECEKEAKPLRKRLAAIHTWSQTVPRRQLFLEPMSLAAACLSCAQSEPCSGVETMLNWATIKLKRG